MKIDGLDNIISTIPPDIRLTAVFYDIDGLCGFDVKFEDIQNGKTEENKGAAQTFSTALTILKHRYVDTALCVWNGGVYNKAARRLTLNGTRFGQPIDDVSPFE